MAVKRWMNSHSCVQASLFVVEPPHVNLPDWLGLGCQVIDTTDCLLLQQPFLWAWFSLWVVGLCMEQVLSHWDIISLVGQYELFFFPPNHCYLAPSSCKKKKRKTPINLPWKLIKYEWLNCHIKYSNLCFSNCNFAWVTPISLDHCQDISTPWFKSTRSKFRSDSGPRTD